MYRNPSPEVSNASPRLASPKSQKPMNIKFNQLRGSQSLPDLSEQELIAKNELDIIINDYLRILTSFACWSMKSVDYGCRIAFLRSWV